MGDSDNRSMGEKIVDAYVILAMVAMFVGAIGFAIHALLILPIKLAVWLMSGNRSDADNLFNMSKLGVAMIGLTAFAVPVYIVNCVMDNKYGFETMHHFIAVAFLLIPIKFIVPETIKEFNTLYEPIGDHCYLEGKHLFGLGWRFAAGIAIVVAMGFAINDAFITA